MQWRCFPYKTPPHHPQSNRITERMEQPLKMGLKTFSPSRDTRDSYLLSNKTIPHAGRIHSPSELLRRKIKSHITMSYSINERT